MKAYPAGNTLLKLLKNPDPLKAAMRLEKHVSPYMPFFEPPNYDNLHQHVKQSPVFVIRHAESKANENLHKLAMADYVSKGDWVDSAFHYDYIDCQLTQKGIEQSELAGIHASKINFKEVWVSPLRRALESAFHIFKDHPSFNEISFKVKPMLREKIRVSCDIPLFNTIEVIERDYQSLFGNRLDLSDLHSVN